MRALHLIELQDGSAVAEGDRLKVAVLPQVAVAAGGGAGAEVTVAVTFSEVMPAQYAVMAEFDQDAVYYTSAKTAKGFTLHVNRRLAADAVAAGKVNLFIVA